MRLITAHKILIGSAIAFFLFFAYFELHRYFASGAVVDLLSGIFGVAVAAAFTLYFRQLQRRNTGGPKGDHG